MIVRLHHETGVVVGGDIPVSEVETPDELAAGLLMLLPDVTRVRVWQNGRSVSDAPDADTTRAQQEADNAAVDEFLRSAHADMLPDLLTILDVDTGLSLILNGAPGWDEAERFLFHAAADSEPKPDDVYQGPGIVPADVVAESTAGMIVRIDYELGVQVEATAPEPDGVMTYVEVVDGLFLAFPAINRVRLWEPGLTIADRPSADGYRDGPNPAGVTVDEYPADAQTGFIAGLAAILDLESGRARIVRGEPDWDKEWRDGPGFIPPG